MNPKGEGIDVMYRNIKHAFFQVGRARRCVLLCVRVCVWRGAP